MLAPKTDGQDTSGPSADVTRESEKIQDGDIGILAFRFRELYIFPLFDECCRTARLPFWASIFLPILLFVQNIGSTLWIGCTTLWDTQLPWQLDFLFMFCDLGLHDHEMSDCWPQLALLYSIILFSSIFLWIVFVYYRTNKSFARWQMYVVTVIVYHVWPLLFAPLSCAVGRSIVAVQDNPTPGNIVVLAVTFIVLAIVNLLTMFCANFYCKSPCLQNGILALWAPDTVILLVMRIEFCAGVSIWIGLFPKWMTVMAFALGMVMMLYELYLLYFMPMCVFWMNGVLMGTVIYSLANSIAVTVHFFTHGDERWIIISPVIVWVCAMFGTSLWFYLRRKKMIRLLTRGRDGKIIMEKSEKYNHFDTIIFSSTRDVCAYLRIGIGNACPLLIDLSFVKYLIESYGGEKDVMFACMRTAALFPFANSVLAASLPVLDSWNSLTLGEEFQIYQLRKINLARQMQTIYFNDDEFDELQKKSTGIISQIRGFWLEIMRSKGDISFAALHALRKETLVVDSLFFDAIEQWPGSQTLNNMYVTFMIEAEANYSSAIRFEKKRQMMAEGKLTVTDSAFRSLVSLYPHYLYDRIVDTKGRRINIGDSFSYNSESSECDSSTNVATDDVDLHYDEIIQDLISQGKLRLAVQNCLRGLKFKPVMPNLLLGLLLLFAVVVCALVILEEVPPYLAEGMTVVMSNNKLAKIALEIQYISFISGIQMLIEDGHFGGTPEIAKTLKLSEEQLPTHPSIMHDPYLAMHNSGLNLLELAEEESAVIMNTRGEITERTLLYAQDYAIPILQTEPFNITVSIRTGMILLASAAEDAATAGAGCRECKEQVLVTGLSLSQHFSDIIKVLIPATRTPQEQDMTTVKISIGAIIGVLFLYLMFRIVSVVWIRREMKVCSRVLKSVKPRAIYDSFQHICLREKKDITFIASAQSTSRMSCVMVFYPLVIVVSTVAVAALLIRAAFSYSESISYVRDLWYMSRFSFIRSLESVSEAVRLFGYVYDLEKYTNYRASNWTEILTYGQILNAWGFQVSDEYSKFYMLSDLCPSNASHYADFVNCSPLSTQADIFAHYCLGLWDQVRPNNFEIFKSPTFSALVYLFDSKIYEGFLEIADQTQQAVDSYAKRADTETTLLFVAALLVAVASALVEYYLCHLLSISFEAFKQLLLLLSPTYIAKEPVIVDFATGQTGQYAKSGSESMLENSIYAVLNVDAALIIQNVSQGFSTLTGFTPDQTLGQPLSWLIPEQGAVQATFYQRLREMMHDCDETMSKMTITAFSENGDKIHVKAAVVARFDKDRSLIQFSILLRDLSSEVAHKKMLKQMKKRADLLIRSLVPEPVCQRLGSPDLPVFTVTHATILYVKIEGLSEAVHASSPELVMNMVDATFEVFEKTSKNHPAMAPIDRWAGVYAAVCGLFGESASQPEQLNEMLAFCFEVLNEIKFLNEKLSVDIHLKFVINAGGPMVGSFLGVQNPVFQVISPIKDLAERLLEVGHVDRVHIPASLLPLIDNRIYVTERIPESVEIDGRAEQILFVNVI